MQIVDRIGSAETTHTLPEKGHRGPWQHPDAASVQGFSKLFRARFGGGARWLHRDDVGSCRRAWARRGPASLRPSIPAAHWPEGAQLSHTPRTAGDPACPPSVVPAGSDKGTTGVFGLAQCRARLFSRFDWPATSTCQDPADSSRFRGATGSLTSWAQPRCRITGNSTGHQRSWAVAERIHDAKPLGICGPLFLGSLGRVLCFSIPSVYIVGLVVHGQKLSSLHIFAYRMIPVYDARLFYGYFFYSMGFKTSFSSPLMG